MDSEKKRRTELRVGHSSARHDIGQQMIGQGEPISVPETSFRQLMIRALRISGGALVESGMHEAQPEQNVGKTECIVPFLGIQWRAASSVSSSAMRASFAANAAAT